MHELEEIYQLIIDGRASAHDKERFITLISIRENETAARRLLEDYVALVENNEAIELISADRLKMIGESIILAESARVESVNDSQPVHRTHFLKTVWLRYAAAILLLITAAATYYFVRTPAPENKLAAAKPPVTNDVLPGSDRAILTLSNGEQVQLNKATAETIRDGSLSIQNNNGQLSYENAAIATINTMTTPKGGQYQLTLADGTRVWLNAASSITYPTVFTGKLREVRVTGEAYFEVAKNKTVPFVVNIDDKSLVQVLGTSFNINSYADEQNIRTTLIEGSVKVSRGTTTDIAASSEQNPESYVILKPGQQARVSEDITVKSDANLSQTLAWKNGLFSFDNSDLFSVMKQLERWYDIQVKYQGNVSDLTLRGEMYRNVALSKVIDFLKKTGVNVKVEGKTLIVSNKIINEVK